MTHPGHPVIANGQERRSDSWPKLNDAFVKVLTAAKTIDFTADSTEATHYTVDASGGAVTATLPLISDATNNRFSFIKTDSSTLDVTVTAQSGESINGASTSSLLSQYDSVVVYNDGTDWWIE